MRKIFILTNYSNFIKFWREYNGTRSFDNKAARYYITYLKFLDEKFNRFFKKQELFEQLLKHKEEIEDEIGHLQWDSKENNKSSKIRKIFEIDINNSDNHECAINERIKMSAELKNIVHKYL